MDLDEFKVRMAERVDKFADSYRKEHVKNPEDWPDEIDGAEWMEQFLVWCEDEE